MSTPPSAKSPQSSGDRDLVENLKAGDENAYEEMVRRYGGRLLAVAKRFLRNDDDAREVLQDALFSAFRGMGGFDGTAHLSTWLHRIVTNAALMKQRTRRRHPEESIEDLLPAFQADGHHAEGPADWKDTADVLVERSDMRRLVRECIDKLPETYRTVLLLRDIEDLDTDEAAAMLEIGTNALKIRLHRARMALRALLDPHMRASA